MLNVFVHGLINEREEDLEAEYAIHTYVNFPTSMEIKTHLHRLESSRESSMEEEEAIISRPSAVSIE